MDLHRHLPRLSPETYRGHAFVHWTMRLQHRATGWLSEEFHVRFREILLHGLHSCGCACPVYCLMPDHIHLLLVGWDVAADQTKLLRFLTRHINRVFGPAFALQKQNYDHVLRDEDERSSDGIASLAWYITENPVRAGVGIEREEYPFTGCMIPGYPELDLWQGEFWERFWRITASKAP
jgi:putative transposase